MIFGLGINAITYPVTGTAVKLLELKSTVGVSPGTTGSGIDSIADQSGNGNTFSSTSPNRPVYVSGSFKGGTVNGIYYESSGSDNSSAASKILCPAGFTALICFKTTSTKSTTGNTNINPPNTVIGDPNTTTSRNQFGLSAAVPRYCYKVGGTTWTTYSASGVTLNDGNVHTMAITHSTAGALAIYADNVSVYTATGVTYDTSNTGIKNVALGYNSADPANDFSLAHLQVWNGIVDTTTLGSLHSADIAAFA